MRPVSQSVGNGVNEYGYGFPLNRASGSDPPFAAYQSFCGDSRPGMGLYDTTIGARILVLTYRNALIDWTIGALLVGIFCECKLRFVPSMLLRGTPPNSLEHS